MSFYNINVFLHNQKSFPDPKGRIFDYKILSVMKFAPFRVGENKFHFRFKPLDLVIILPSFNPLLPVQKYPPHFY